MTQDKGSLARGGKQSMVAVRVERNSGYGQVPSLEDEELADPVELERQVVLDEWGPILALPVDKNGSWIRPDIDENGEVEWGAFGTHDFERLYGSFDKARYKMDKLQEELRWAMVRMEVAAGRVAKGMIYYLTRGLRSGGIGLEHIDDMNQYFFAQRFLQMLRIDKEIRELRERRARREAQAAAFEG